MEQFGVKMWWLIALGIIALVKTSAADSTSDFTSPVDDQYAWSALAQRKGPTVQDNLDWKWTDDRSEKEAIDGVITAESNNHVHDKHFSGLSEDQEFEDQGPGSIEIYRLTNFDSPELSRILLPPWNNPSTPEKVLKTKSPKSLYYPPKHHKNPVNPPEHVRATQTAQNRAAQVVPELQIGCEGLEAPIEPSARFARSVSAESPAKPAEPAKSPAKSAEPAKSPAEPAPSPSTDPEVPPMNPVKIDWDYSEDDQPRIYEDMDELLKLKAQENLQDTRHRGDMGPDDDSSPDFDSKRIPTRGDLASGRKVRSILSDGMSPRAPWRSNGPWGFAEDDGYISDEDESHVQTEADRQRQVYQRAQHREIERRRQEQLERQRASTTRNNHENSEIDRIRKEYEERLMQEQKEREEKLREYVARNRPIVVENRGGRPHDRSRGPSPPAMEWGVGRNDVRIREEEERRKEEERRREEDRRRTEERARMGEMRRAEERRREEDRRREQERRREGQRGEDERRREDEMKQLEEQRRGRERGEDQRRGEVEREREEERRRMEQRRREEERERQRERGEGDSRREEEKRRQDERDERSRMEERRREDERRRMEERRNEEERKRMEDRRRLQERQGRRNDTRSNDVTERRREEERRRELERRRGSDNNPYRWQEERRAQENERRLEEERRNGVVELKQRVPGVISLDEAERRKWDETRLNALPVSARIILVPNPRSSTSSPLFPSRGGFDDDDDDDAVNFPGINPNRPGLNAGRFPAPRTPKPPSNPPDPCVWAVVQCCPNGDQRRLSSCFEYLGCPGVNWDPNPCGGAVSDAARAVVAQYYATADQP